MQEPLLCHPNLDPGDAAHPPQAQTHHSEACALSVCLPAASLPSQQTQKQGKRMKEGAHINRSLLALGNCINALSEKRGSRAQFVNFRDSKLMRLLKVLCAAGSEELGVSVAGITAHIRQGLRADP